MDMTKTWNIAPALPVEVEQAEDAFNTFAQQAEDAPHKWGEEQEQELGRLAENLRRLYEKHNVAAIDRVAL